MKKSEKMSNKKTKFNLNKNNKTINSTNKIDEFNIKLISKLFVPIFILALIFDQIISLFILTHSNNIVTSIFEDITLLGNIVYFAIILLIILIIYNLNSKKTFGLISAIVVAESITFILKEIFGRIRPYDNFHIQITNSVIGASFPSGHATLFFALVPSISREFPKFKIGIWIIAILVALSRVMLGVHYLSDVIFGAFIGLSIGYLMQKIQDRYLGSG